MGRSACLIPLFDPLTSLHPLFIPAARLNAWYSQAAGDYGTLSAELYVCLCVAGLFGEDLLQPGYRSVSAALAYRAARLGAATRQVALAIRTSDSLPGISTASPMTVCSCSPRTARTWLRVGWPWLRRA
ncbi:hypothetical protein GCM10010521_53950 [Streptomyces rameus]|uniref:Uncharacterized protein n=1 Tax=Streptomyces rameus TaxID=68261 RepID=A0ABP6NXE9_9ACTN